jgi:hypothetical protein
MLTHLLDTDDLKSLSLQSENKTVAANQGYGPLALSITLELMAVETRHPFQLFDVLGDLDDIDA